MRDLLKKSAYGVNFLLVGIENQDEIHYAMPLRVMGYDFRSYDREFRKIKNRHKRRRDLSGAEFLSGFSKADRLKPIITLVVYYGENPWDGPLSLKDMLDWSGIPEKIKQKVQDYPVYFLDVRRFSGIEKMKTDARLVFGFLQRQDDREKLAEYIQKNAEEFDRLDSDAGDMITVLANIEEPMRKYMEESKNERGEVKVCKALTEMREEARLEGERAERERSE